MLVSTRAAVSAAAALALSVLPVGVTPAGATTTAGCPAPRVTRIAVPIPPGVSTVTPVAISPNGRYVVGNVVTTAFGFHAYRFFDGISGQLDSPRSTFGLVSAVNDSGTAAGIEFSASGRGTAFVHGLGHYVRIQLAGYSITTYGINARGQVALVLQDAQLRSYPGIYDHGTVTRIPSHIQLAGLAGGPVIDADGDLAYAAPSPGGRTHAVLYDAASRTVRPLAMPAGVHDPIVSAIGPGRSVVATATTWGRDDQRAVWWPSPTAPGTLLPTTSGKGISRVATGSAVVSSGGVVTGTEYLPTDRRGILETGRPVTWSGATPTRLPVPDPANSDSTVAVNDAGTVAGNEETQSSVSHALAWRCGEVVRLTDGTETSSTAIGLSRNDIVLGTYQSPTDAKPVPVLWIIQ